ncbi:MAG: recombinase family protein [Holosporaceae bacterium]|nr:recombinase family protein [Holosporaceae bacterium]
METESYRKIADELNKAKHRTKSVKTQGGKAFDHGYVRKILLNIQYKGYVKHKENVYVFNQLCKRITVPSPSRRGGIHTF